MFVFVFVSVFVLFQMGRDPGHAALSSLAGEWESLSVTLHLPTDKGSGKYFSAFIIFLFSLSLFLQQTFFTFFSESLPLLLK